MKRTDLLRGNLDLALLASLRDRPLHGYAIVQELKERSDGEFDVLEGTLYPALHRIEGGGLVKSRWSTEGGRRRREYELTRRGRASLRKRTQEWETFARNLNLVIGERR